VVHGVHARDHGQQHLRGADVARRLLAADVLLARLQRQPVRLVAVSVDAHADQPAGQTALELVAAGHERRVRAAIGHRHTEALAVADDDVGAPFARRRQQRKGQQIGADDEGRVFGVHDAGVGVQVMNRAASRWVADQHSEVVVGGQQRVPLGAGVGQLDDDAQRLGARLHDLDRLRVAIARDHDHVALGLDAALGQRHRFGGGCRFIEHRRVGDRHGGQVADHRLKIDQRFQPALRDLRLVGRVSGVPSGVLEDVAQDDAWRDRAVVALADEVLEDLVLRRHRLQLFERLRFGDGLGQVHRLGTCDRARHHGVDQRAAGCGADDRQHVLLIALPRADVPGTKLGSVFQFRQGRGGGLQHGSSSQRVFSSLSYAGGSISSSNCSMCVTCTLKNQPLPIGSVLASAGSARSASLTSTISPSAGM
jgi:hypothetical protein